MNSKTATSPHKPDSESRGTFAPGASLEMLRLRAELLRATRRFFEAAGYLEVETPLLSPDIVVDAHLEPFVTRFTTDPGQLGDKLFLQTSPEFSLKRLLAAGSGPVFEVFRAFRNGERGARHNPEFTLIEWYGPGDTHLDQMAFTERYLRQMVLCVEAHGIRPVGLGEQYDQGEFERITYDNAFLRYAGSRVLSLPIAEFPRLALERGVSVPFGLTADESQRDNWLNLLLAELVEPHLGTERPTFLYDYPASQAALAKVRHDDPPVAERFELYVDGVELCNGYHELLDAHELRDRIATQNALRAAAGFRRLPANSRLLAAMEHGLPACSGVALGFDRLLMTLLGESEIAAVRAFVTESGDHV